MSLDRPLQPLYAQKRERVPGGDRAAALDGFSRPNLRCGLATMAQFVRVQDAPAPGPADYQAWMDEMHPTRKTGRLIKIDGRQLHRAATMRRNGCTLKETAASVGVSLRTLVNWLDALPPHLSPRPAPVSA